MRRPVLVRGGIIADEASVVYVCTGHSLQASLTDTCLFSFIHFFHSIDRSQVGYGKTAITLGLIDSAAKSNDNVDPLPASLSFGVIQTKATLVVVPKHLMVSL